MPSAAKCGMSPLRSRGRRRGDLLREAVERAEARDEHAAVDRHDMAAREAVPDDRAGGIVLGAAEHGHEHRAVRNIEIRIARRQALRLEILRRGTRQLDDLERSAAYLELGEPASIRGER